MGAEELIKEIRHRALEKSGACTDAEIARLCGRSRQYIHAAFKAALAHEHALIEIAELLGGE